MSDVVLGFDILFEDTQLLVVNKPAGIATQAPRQFDSLESRIRRYQLLEEPSNAPYLGIPHRLDRCVSGVVVFAKRKKAAQRLSKQFERRSVHKQYLALVAGDVHPADGTWTDHLRKIPELPRAEVVDEQHAEGRIAIMHYQVEWQDDQYSRLRVRLETGRMHQIRLQCSSRDFPIVGDAQYGSTELFGPTWEHERERAIALHASTISFDHPKTRETVQFEAPLPAYWTVFST